MVSKYVELNSTSATSSTNKILKKKKTVESISSQRFNGIVQPVHTRGSSQIHESYNQNDDADYGQNSAFNQGQSLKPTPQESYSPGIKLPNDNRLTKQQPQPTQPTPNKRKGQKLIMSNTMEDFDKQTFSPGIAEIKSKNKAKMFRKRKAESGSDFTVKTNSQNMMQFQFDDLCPTEEVSPLITKHSDAYLSTSVGTHRSERLSKDQLMTRVHKEQKQVMDVLGQQLDKVGNGFAAMGFVMKKLNGKMKDEVAKELAKRGKCQQTRKLFSIYRYRTGHKEANDIETPSPLLRSGKLSLGSVNQDNIADNDPGVDDTVDTVVAKKEDPTKFNSCMHYYKRDLSPIKEAFTQCNIKTPYRQNFENYGANMMSKDFKSSLLKSLGSGVKCLSSVNQNRRLSTYYKQIEIAALPIGQRDTKSFLPAEGCLQSSVSRESLASDKDQSPKPTIKAMLMKRQLQQNLTFNKLPAQQSSSSNAQNNFNESSIESKSPIKLNSASQLQTALEQDGPSDPSETVSARLRRKLLEQSCKNTQVKVERSHAMLIEELGSKGSKGGDESREEVGDGLLDEESKQVSADRITLSRNAKRKSGFDELQIASAEQSQEEPSFTTESVEKQDKQLPQSKTTGAIGRLSLQPNAISQKLSAKLMQKSDYKGSTVSKQGTKVSRQNYQSLNSKQGSSKQKTAGPANQQLIKQTPSVLNQTQSTRNTKNKQGSFQDKFRPAGIAPIDKKMLISPEESPYESHQNMTQPEQNTPSWITSKKNEPSRIPVSNERAHSAQSRKSNSQSSALDNEQGVTHGKRQGATVMAFLTPNQQARKQHSFKAAKKARGMTTRLVPLSNSESKADDNTLPSSQQSQRTTDNNLRKAAIHNSTMVTSNQYTPYGVQTIQKESIMLINESSDQTQPLQMTTFKRNNVSTMENKPIEILQKNSLFHQTPKAKFFTDQSEPSVIIDSKQNNSLALSNNQIYIKQPIQPNLDDKNTQELSQQYFTAIKPNDKLNENVLALSPNDLLYKSKRHSTIQKKQMTMFSELPKDLVPPSANDQFSIPPAFLVPTTDECGKKTTTLISREKFNAALDVSSQLNRIDSQDTRFFNQRHAIQQQPKLGNYKQVKSLQNSQKPQNKAQQIEQQKFANAAQSTQEQLISQYARTSQQQYESSNQALVQSPPPRNTGIIQKQAINVINLTTNNKVQARKFSNNKIAGHTKYSETTPQSVVTSQNRQRKTSVQRASVGRTSASIQNNNIIQELYKQDNRHLPQL